MTVSVRQVEHLSPDEYADVVALIDAAASADGVRPLDEQATIDLRGDAPDTTHLLGSVDDTVVGYARLHRSDGTAGGDVVVHPTHRRHGIGRALVDELLAAAAGQALAVWAHGPHPDAAKIAADTGFEAARELWRMRRDLALPFPDFPVPEGITIRTFRPGEDDEAFLAVNAKAFAEHPEQGRWRQPELDARLAEPWFDPAGFFVADRDGQFVGYHWTKVHEPPVRGEAPDARAGEVYVLGLDPAAQAGGLGKALLVAGLRSLRDRGLPVVMLYAESDNDKAIKLYEKLGFDHVDTDVRYRHPGTASLS
ncbi:mycothiol synthase [Tenggerimyces flavus]|uniref:Mycothiol acetyltransferase n=1 Tax=Tenggerimyces flavus TaxID=1708749 RepID=A0ABV7YH16_9ACTN|nr:mycothiol synthase [Tenggerimyces flavus]MBM7783868.1 mycothiol synthase [Tenggerimyces flavus]